MDIIFLPKSVRESLRTGQNIKSYSVCIRQLVYNSLDAKSTAIAVRLNLISHKIQVIDNGNGITKNNLKVIGTPYMTSKYYEIKDEKKYRNIFGYRGETISSIRHLSTILSITTKAKGGKYTYNKTFNEGKSKEVTKCEDRSSFGTTVTIEGFLYNNPVRQNYLEKDSVLLEIKNELETIALIHPYTSFSLRDDNNKEIILQLPKTKYTIKSSEILFGSLYSQNLYKISHKNNEVSISGLIGTQGSVQRKVQFVYINKISVKKTKIHELINKLLIKHGVVKSSIVTPNGNVGDDKNLPVIEKHGIFIINISCPKNEIDIIDSEYVEFKNWDEILSCIQCAVEEWLEKFGKLSKLTDKKTFVGEPVEEGSEIRPTDMSDVVQTKFVKRKKVLDIEKKMDENKKQKLIINKEEEIEMKPNETQVMDTTENKVKTIKKRQISDESKVSIKKDKIKKIREILENANYIKPNMNEKLNDKYNKAIKNIMESIKKKEIMKIKRQQKLPLKVSKKKNIKQEESKNDGNKFPFVHRQNDVLQNILESMDKKRKMKNNFENVGNKVSDKLEDIHSKIEDNHVTNIEENIYNMRNNNYNDNDNYNHNNNNNQMEDGNKLVVNTNYSLINKFSLMDIFLKSTELYKNDDELTEEFLFYEKPIVKAPPRKPKTMYSYLTKSEKTITLFDNAKITKRRTRQILTKTKNPKFLPKYKKFDRDNNFRTNNQACKNINEIFKNIPDKNCHKHMRNRTHVFHNPFPSTVSHREIHLRRNRKVINRIKMNRKLDRKNKINNKISFFNNSFSDGFIKPVKNIKNNKNDNTNRLHYMKEFNDNLYPFRRDIFNVNDYKSFHNKNVPFKFNFGFENVFKPNSILTDSVTELFPRREKQFDRFLQNDRKNYFKFDIDGNCNGILDNRNKILYSKNFMGNLFKPKGIIDFPLNNMRSEIRYDGFSDYTVEKDFQFNFGINKKNDDFFKKNTNDYRNKILGTDNFMESEPKNILTDISSKNEIFPTGNPFGGFDPKFSIHQNFHEKMFHNNIIDTKCESKKYFGGNNMDKYTKNNYFETGFNKHINDYTKRDKKQEIDFNRYLNENNRFRTNNYLSPNKNKKYGANFLDDNHFKAKRYKYCYPGDNNMYIDCQKSGDQKINSNHENIFGERFNQNVFRNFNELKSGNNFTFGDNNFSKISKEDKIGNPTHHNDKVKLFTPNFRPNKKIQEWEKYKNRKYLNEKIIKRNNQIDSLNDQINPIPSSYNSHNYIKDANMFERKNKKPTEDINMSKSKSISSNIKENSFHTCSNIKKINNNDADITSEYFKKYSQDLNKNKSGEKSEWIRNLRNSKSKGVKTINKELPIDTTGYNLENFEIKIQEALMSPDNHNNSLIQYIHHNNNQIPSDNKKNQLSDKIDKCSQKTLKSVDKTNSQNNIFGSNNIENFITNTNIINDKKPVLKDKFNLHPTPDKINTIVGNDFLMNEPDKNSLSSPLFNNRNESKLFQFSEPIQCNKSGKKNYHCSGNTKKNQFFSEPIQMDKKIEFNSKNEDLFHSEPLFTNETDRSLTNYSKRENRINTDGSIKKKLNDSFPQKNSSSKNISSLPIADNLNDHFNYSFNIVPSGDIISNLFDQDTTGFHFLLNTKEDITKEFNKNDTLPETISVEKQNLETQNFSKPNPFENLFGKNNQINEELSDDIKDSEKLGRNDDLNMKDSPVQNKLTNDSNSQSFFNVGCKELMKEKKLEEKNSSKNESFDAKNYLEVVYSEGTKNSSKLTNDNTSTKENIKDDEINKNLNQNLESISEWIEKTDEFGNIFHLNTLNGMTKFTMRNQYKFSVSERNNCVPKGMSPILFTILKPSKQLTPISKDELHKTLARFDNPDDLRTVKWLKYLKDGDTTSFFESLYESNKYYESDIPSVYNEKNSKSTKKFDDFRFSRNMFDDISVINQWDNKFIITHLIDNGLEYLILFDQHAVHERIRLEKLMKDYFEENFNKLKKIKCKTPMKINLHSSELQIMKNYKNHFEEWGFIYENEDGFIKITHIPLLLGSKDDSYKEHTDKYPQIKVLIELIIKEKEDFLRTTGRINSTLPNILLNLIKNEACKSAIRFGDKLTIEECKKLLNQLKSCDLPFQCAHGRPTLIPMINLKKILPFYKPKVKKINLKKLMMENK